MKNKNHIQYHPNQEDKTGKATFGSSTGLNSSTTRRKPSAKDMTEGAETDFKDEVHHSKNKKVKPILSKTPKQ